MARCAIVLLEEFIAAQLLLGQSRVVALQPLIESRVGRYQRTLELLDRVGDVGLVQTIGIDSLECSREGAILFELCHDLVERGRCHLNGIERRTCGLLCQRAGTTVPELNEVIDSIVGRRSIDATQLTLNAFRVLFIVDTCGIQTMARCARNGVVDRQTCVVIERITQQRLASVDVGRLGNRTHGLACALTLNAVGIVLLAVLTCPIDDDVALGVGHLATPMHEVVLRLGHTFVESHLLDLSHIDRARQLTRHKRLVERLDVECAVARIDILFDHFTGYGQFGIEGQLGIRGVAIQTATLNQNCRNTRLGRIFSRRRAVRNAIDGNEYNGQH